MRRIDALGGQNVSFDDVFAKSVEVPAPYSNLERPCRMIPGRMTDYVYVQIEGKLSYLHHHAFKKLSGNKPIIGRKRDGFYVVAHRCDRKSCIEPTHMENITQAQNVADCYARNRLDVEKRAAKLRNRKHSRAWSENMANGLNRRSNKEKTIWKEKIGRKVREYWAKKREQQVIDSQTVER